MVTVTFTIYSTQLDKEEIRRLLQSIRDCEMKYFPNKEIVIWVEVPELTNAECTEILASINPPFKYGPSVNKIRFGGGP